MIKLQFDKNIDYCKLFYLFDDLVLFIDDKETILRFRLLRGLLVQILSKNTRIMLKYELEILKRSIYTLIYSEMLS